MKFFLPAAKDAAQAESAFDGIRKFSSEQLGAALAPGRVYSVSGVHDGKAFTATVGKVFERLAEPVIAILLDQTRKCYLICTPNRGVLRDMPYLSGENEITPVEYFEE